MFNAAALRSSIHAGAREIPPRIDLEEAASRTVPGASPKSRRAAVPFICFSVLAVCSATLYFFDPAHFGFYPKCALYQSTGLLCPGCGSLRALHQLLHGHWAEALRFNALLVLFLPLAFLYGATYLLLYRLPCYLLLEPMDRSKIERLQAFTKIRPIWVWIGFVILVLFGVWRNLPFVYK